MHGCRRQSLTPAKPPQRCRKAGFSLPGTAQAWANMTCAEPEPQAVLHFRHSACARQHETVPQGEMRRQKKRAVMRKNRAAAALGL